MGNREKEPIDRRDFIKKVAGGFAALGAFSLDKKIKLGGDKSFPDSKKRAFQGEPETPKSQPSNEQSSKVPKEEPVSQTLGEGERDKVIEDLREQYREMQMEEDRKQYKEGIGPKDGG